MKHRRVTLVLALSLGAHAGAQEPTADLRTVEGRVVDLRGEGVPVAKVVVVNSIDETVLARTVADGEGFYKLSKVPRLDHLEVRAAADGFCEGRACFEEGEAPIVEMQHALTIRGIVRNRAGNGAPGVAVQARPNAGILNSVRADARTAADGTFVLTGVPIGPVQIAAYVEGEGLALVNRHVRENAEIELQPDDSPRVDLTVTVQGLPKDRELRVRLLAFVKNAIVQLPPPLDLLPLDASGTWTGRALPAFEYVITPLSETLAFAPREHITERGKPERLEFTATRIGAATLQIPAVVRDAAGNPVAGVGFVLRSSLGGPRSTATSDATGSLLFASPIGVGERAIAHTTDGPWVVDPWRTVDSDPRSDARFANKQQLSVHPETTLELRVVRACAVRGRLLQPDGRPAAFVPVELQQGMENRWPRWMPMAFATTDRQGHYEIRGLHHVDDPLRIHVEHATGYQDSDPFQLEREGTSIEIPEARLSAPATIEGVVLDRERRPVPGIRVWLRELEVVGLMTKRERNGNIVERITDRDGRYRFRGVPPGGAMLQVLPGFERGAREKNAAEPIEVEAGKTHSVDLDWK